MQGCPKRNLFTLCLPELANPEFLVRFNLEPGCALSGKTLQPLHVSYPTEKLGVAYLGLFFLT
jgi:hypothetical protein